MKKTPVYDRNFIWFLISLTSACALFVYLFHKGPFMMTNDNFYLRSILSGQMTGTPDLRAYFLGVFFGKTVSSLYRLYPYIPWYGYAMLGSVLISLTYVIYRLILVTGNKILRLFLLLFCIAVTYFFYTQHIVKVEFTTITGIVGCAAVFSYYLLDESRDHRHYLLSVLPVVFLSLWSLGMREDAFFMLIPFFGMITVGKALDTFSKKSSTHTKNLLILLLLLSAVFTISRSVTFLVYQSDEWRDYRTYTAARAEIHDFYGYPDYDTHSTVYEDLGITRSSYEAARSHYNLLLDPAINRDSMVTLSQIARAESAAVRPSLSHKLVDVIRQFIERNFLTWADRPLNVLVYLLYAICFILIILSKNRSALRDFLFLIVARTFDWTYLIWGGRYPSRVTQIILTADLFLLIGILIRYRLWEMGQIHIKNRVIYPAAMISMVLVCITGLRFGVSAAKAHIWEVNTWYSFSAGYRELENYLYDHQDSFYYFDMTALYFTEEVFDDPVVVTDPLTGKQKIAQHNYVYMGSWMANSPWYDTVLSQEGITDIGDALFSKDNVYLIYQPVNGEEPDFLKDYIKDHYPGASLQKVDELLTSTGMTYEFWKGYME